MVLRNVCGRRGEGRTSGMASVVCMEKGMCNAGLQDYLNHPDQPRCKAKRMANDGNCLLNALLVLENSVSTCL